MAPKNKRPARVSPAAPQQTAAEFNPDYTQVKKDLTRIGLLSGTFFILLVALSFVIK
ncbi:MAG TPA: hypothetical protein PKE35_14005 [Anaerolineales bacterium]|nr:hypothetical protein [Anaerolineales bacterium]HMV96573.1 hypothetical protein [Anaerolineales bacterium]HMX20401.1 hypothetical protein [Anaerolineales bacterium]HMX75365.1 hypothetical protein [Anaerolineales bacterium]HMZ44121.1 hypothetical protein [Anaerolineales bacterium]